MSQIINSLTSAVSAGERLQAIKADEKSLKVQEKFS